MFLPIPFLWKLRTTTSQKSVLTGIFLCAALYALPCRPGIPFKLTRISSVCVVSIIRVVVLSRLTNFDVTWNYVDAAIWSAAEPCMGVVAACLPSLRPLLAVVIRGTHRGPTIHSKSAQKTISTNSSRIMWSRRDTDGDEMDHMDNQGFTRLEDQSSSSPRWGHDVHAKGGREKRKKSIPGNMTQEEDQISLEEMVPQKGIKVKTEVTITTSGWEYKDRIF